MAIELIIGTRRRDQAEQRRRLAAAEGYLRAIEQELEATSPEEAITAIRRLKALQPDSIASGVLPDAGGVNLSDPRVAVSRIRDFATKVAALNGTVTSMEEQLKSLYSDRERLEREIGASEADDVVAAFRSLQTTIQSMESQLMTLYAGRELLDVELGRSDPKEIVAMFRNVTHLVNGARLELQTVAEDR